MFRIAAALALACLPVDAHAQTAWNPDPWVEDLETIRTALHEKYANREWLEQERGVPIDPILDLVESMVRRAGSDAEARATLDLLIRKIDDGHVSLRWPRPEAPAAATTEAPAPLPTSPAQFCRAQGYSARGGGGTAKLLPGYTPLAAEGLFPAGIVPVGEAHVGVLRIGEFSPEAFPALCEGIVRDLAIPIDRPCEDDCRDALITEAYRRLTFAWMERIQQLRDAGATHLLIDETGNGGGSEWAEAAARTLTPQQLVSARFGFVRGSHWEKQWGDLAETLRTAADESDDPSEKARLTEWAAQAEAARVVAATPCDPADGCEWLGRAGYATGLVGSAPDGAFADVDWGASVFSAGQYAYPYRSGVWNGPLIVLVDQETWSAAEEFAALLQDNDAAIILGARTGGAGCGHTWGGTPTTLPNSGAVLELPDCVRFRRDGSNEVRGILPDVTIPWRADDGATLKRQVLEAAMPEALRRAEVLYAEHTQQ